MPEDVKGTPKEQGLTIENVAEVVNTLLNKVEELSNEIESLKKTTVKKSTGLFGGKREKTAIKDTKTGKVYPSKAAVGRNLASEFGLDITDNFAWYKIQLRAPDRFVKASPEEAEKAWKDQEAATQKAVDEANKKLAEEEAAKKVATSKTKK
jgi:hypothetical protein